MEVSVKIFQQLIDILICSLHGCEAARVLTENMDKMFDVYFFDSAYNTEKSKMDYWATGEPLDGKQRKQRRNSITIQNYIPSLKREFPTLEECLTRFFPRIVEPLLKKMDDFTHGNELGNYTQELKPQKMIQNDAIDLTAIILSYISLINATLLRSDDYVGALEFGMTPEKGSQAWIASAFSDFFDTYVDPKYPGFKSYTTLYCIRIS